MDTGPRVLCAVCTHDVRAGDACDCSCHDTCAQRGVHSWRMTPAELARRELVCYRCGERLPLLEANAS